MTTGLPFSSSPSLDNDKINVQVGFADNKSVTTTGMNKWDKVVKSGLSKFCGRQPFKISKDMVCLSSLSKNLLSPLLNILCPKCFFPYFKKGICGISSKAIQNYNTTKTELTQNRCNGELRFPRFKTPPVLIHL